MFTGKGFCSCDVLISETVIEWHTLLCGRLYKTIILPCLKRQQKRTPLSMDLLLTSQCCEIIWQMTRGHAWCLDASLDYPTLSLHCPRQLDTLKDVNRAGVNGASVWRGFTCGCVESRPGLCARSPHSAGLLLRECFCPWQQLLSLSLSYIFNFLYITRTTNHHTHTVVTNVWL